MLVPLYFKSRHLLNCETGHKRIPLGSFSPTSEWNYKRSICTWILLFFMFLLPRFSYLLFLIPFFWDILLIAIHLQSIYCMLLSQIWIFWSFSGHLRNCITEIKDLKHWLIFSLVFSWTCFLASSHCYLQDWDVNLL